jgi:hypothetical protein
LQRLCSADLTTFERHERIQRHVLRFEWRNPHTSSRQQSADPGNNEALPDIGAGPENGKSWARLARFRHGFFLRLS